MLLCSLYSLTLDNMQLILPNTRQLPVRSPRAAERPGTAHQLRNAKHHPQPTKRHVLDRKHCPHPG